MIGRNSAKKDLNCQATHDGHPYIEDCHLTSRLFEPREKGGRMVKLLHNKTGRIKQTTERPQHGGVIVEEPDTIAGGSTQRRAFRVQIFETIKGICIGHVMIQSGLLRITMGLRSMPLWDLGLIPHIPDRKSTRLNSSHSQISYAVFCLKKK